MNAEKCRNPVRMRIVLASFVVACSPFLLKALVKDGIVHEIVSNDAEAAIPAANRDALKSMKTESDVLEKFSVPDLERRDGAARVLQYSSDACILDVYLNGNSIVHYDLRMPETAVFIAEKKIQNLAQPDESGCIEKLSARR